MHKNGIPLVATEMEEFEQEKFWKFSGESFWLSEQVLGVTVEAGAGTACHGTWGWWYHALHNWLALSSSGEVTSFHLFSQHSTQNILLNGGGLLCLLYVCFTMLWCSPFTEHSGMSNMPLQETVEEKESGISPGLVTGSQRRQRQWDQWGSYNKLFFL